MGKGAGNRMVANNKKAYHDYFIEDKYEAGVALAGTEVKSLRMGKCSIKESFVKIERGEVFIYGMHISPYEHGSIFNRDPAAAGIFQRKPGQSGDCCGPGQEIV